MSDEINEHLKNKQKQIQQQCKEIYQERLNYGVAREVARFDLPLSNYTEIFWKMDLRNLFHFLKLRLDPHAQKEIREYAHVIAGITKELFPISFEAFEDYMLNSVSFSAQEMDNLQFMLGNPFTYSENMILALCKGLSPRECREFADKCINEKHIEIKFNPENYKTYEELEAGFKNGS